MYAVYIKHRSYKYARGTGVITDSYDRAVDMAYRNLNSWWGKNGIYEWVKIKDIEKNKYILTILNDNCEEEIK